MNSKFKPKILVFVPYYLPGFGGPLKTLVNLTTELSDKYDFFIITSDRDPSSKKSYDGININCWNQIGSVKVFYCSPDKKNIFTFLKLLKEESYNAVYFNSFFSYSFTIVPLLIIRYIFNFSFKVIIAPRGEFNAGALKIKKIKKIIYINFFKLFLFSRNIIFQASSIVEVKTIKSEFLLFKNKLNIFEAPDFPSPYKEVIKPYKNMKNTNDQLMLVFLSRITPMKNLVFLLRVLQNCSKEIQFDIYGPIRDNLYWSKCLDLISKMPPNVNVSYLGEKESSLVTKTFSKYHLFALPTLGENFGHVIIESLFAGTPVILSDNTPWAASDNLSLKIISLSDFEKWVKYLDSFLEKYDSKSTENEAIKYGKKLISQQRIYEKNVTLFDFVCS